MLRTRIHAGIGASLLLSLVSALLWTLAHSADRFVPAWVPKYGAEVAITLRLPHGPRLERNIQTGRHELHHLSSDVLVPRGTVLNPTIETHRLAYEQEVSARPPTLPRLLGVFSIFFLLAFALSSYLRRFGENRLKLLRPQVGLFCVMGLVVIASKLGLLFSPWLALWLPASALPLWVAVVCERRTAILISAIIALVLSSLVHFDLLLLAVLLASGSASVLFYREKKRSRYLVLAGLLGGACAALVYVAIHFSLEGRFELFADLRKLGESHLLACLGGGAGSGVLAATLSSLVARAMGRVSRDKLLDLTDLEQPLLQRLSSEAPGTWEHSRAMANLAEQAASSIGADALLTRVGAYYHDIGKTAQRRYFVENLGAGEASPHDQLDPDVSADAIMAHVVVGTQLMRDGGIPEPVVEFAYTHHGTQLVEYFWNKCLQQGNPKGLDESAFRYPGMKPQTKETAILMVVDSIEAASRTVAPPSRDNFEEMIQRVVFTKLASGQLDESGLELADLRIIITRMTDTLVNMNHHRIKYQWQSQQAEEFGVSPRAMQPSTVDSSEPKLEVARAEVEERPEPELPPPPDTAKPAGPKAP